MLNGKRLEALAEIVVPTFVEHGTPPISGIDGFRGFLEGLVAGLPDVRLTEDGRLIERWAQADVAGIIEQLRGS